MDKLNVLIINGSPREGGNCAIALREMENVFDENGIGYETVRIGSIPVRGCVACCLQPVLEQHPRPQYRSGRAGRRGLADHAHTCAEHELSYEKHRPRQGSVRPARVRSANCHELYKMKMDIKNPRLL